MTVVKVVGFDDPKGMAEVTALSLPTRSRGRQSAAAAAAFDAELEAWCEALLQMASRLDFKVSSRGWCYLLEEDGLAKGDFARAQSLINDCRKSGRLPLDFCAEDSAREFDGLERLDADSVAEQADSWLYTLRTAHERYTPVSFWDAQPVYLQLLVEKVDLKMLFADTCEDFHIPFANARGWSDINSRAAMMRRFDTAEAKGQQPVLLYCGDHDPAGLLIADTLRANMAELADAVGWDPVNLIVDRFGLNRDFIDAQGLTWIDGLETGSGDDLANRDHKQHYFPHVQAYLREHGPRKVEANALVTRADEGRQLLRDTIAKYLPADATQRYEDSLKPVRAKFRKALRSGVRAWVKEA